MLAEDVYWQKMKYWWHKDADQENQLSLTVLIFPVAHTGVADPMPVDAATLQSLSNSHTFPCISHRGINIY